MYLSGVGVIWRAGPERRERLAALLVFLPVGFAFFDRAAEVDGLAEEVFDFTTAAQA
jgi:hypothetical protein